jgi:hypothetical protein
MMKEKATRLTPTQEVMKELNKESQNKTKTKKHTLK